MAGLYIHIPFCHSKCAYCDFFSTPVRMDLDLLVDCLIKEFNLRHNEIGSIDTVYIGGGTPSVLEDRTIERLLNHIPLANALEVTMEANPEDVSSDRVRRWKDMGINRISMGVQSFVDEELRIIGRKHNSSTAIKAIENIHKGGIDNFSVDLIYTLPGQTVTSWTYSMETMLALAPRHFSAYMLTYEPRTRLTAMANSGKIVPIDEDTAVEMYKILIEIACKAGYDHYEISNFSLPGFRSRHNSSYWKNTPYLGLGPAAHSFDGKIRKVNFPDIRKYIEAIEKDREASTIEKESRTDIYNDLVITALRTKEGLDFNNVARGRRRQFLCDAFPYLRRGELVVNDNHFSIPEKHWLISDAILRDLMQ